MYRTYRTTAYSNVFSTSSAADGGITYHQVGSRSGRYYRRRVNANRIHKAVVDVETITAEVGLALLQKADAQPKP